MVLFIFEILKMKKVIFYNKNKYQKLILGFSPSQKRLPYARVRKISTLQKQMEKEKSC